jgi:hypothetical protein
VYREIWPGLEKVLQHCQVQNYSWHLLEAEIHVEQKIDLLDGVWSKLEIHAFFIFLFRVDSDEDMIGGITSYLYNGAFYRKSSEVSGCLPAYIHFIIRVFFFNIFLCLFG